MNKFARVTLFLPFAALLVACGGASSDDVRDAKSDAKERGFAVLSTRTYSMESEVYVDVSFGEGGCSGTIEYDGSPTLSIELPIPGVDTETTDVDVDNPEVSRLKSDPAFSHCFVAP